MLSQINNEKSEQQHFDAMAGKYDRNYRYNNDFFTYKKKKKLSPLFDILMGYKLHDISLLELGCGTGEYTSSLAEKFPKLKITGIDISAAILREASEKCKKYPRVKFIQASAYNLPFPKEKFDVVCGFYVAHHLDLKKMFLEIQRVIKTGGTIYIVEPNILNPVVFLIKNIPYLKKLVGDSPSETALNPLTLSRFIPRNIVVDAVLYSEFLPPLEILPIDSLIKLDRITSVFSKIPGIKLMSGSLIIKLKARNN